ncbi:MULTISPECIES: hypothetical protein [unclassified Psychrobacter]|uniref:hypothetical protein n=1 Tax=unclassified Psychrobacter TaxID=196806 RepID=UPI000EB9AAC6|nr:MULTISPECIES: hypothetical protein [unclassified Psychrobacter]MBE8608117.1 hypothetical protein [Pseudomonas lundensis]HCI75991.1 hypothetical protein [Psychrobacter sp.]
MKMNILTAAVITSSLAMFASSANAAMTTDNHGNVGYDSYEECVTAVKDGSAKFYTPYTYQNPKRQAGEATVKKMRLSEVMIPQTVVNANNLTASDYSAGACDLGVGQSNGRYGVSGALVGKYVPIAADMPVNVYMDKAGNPVRLSMQQCDNHFGAKFPTPIMSETKEATAPEAQLAIIEDRRVEPVIVETTRVIRPTKYSVKEVIIVPKDQIKRVNTASGTAIAIEDEANRTVIVGEEADADVIDNTEINQTFPVIRVPSSSTQQRVVDPNTGKYIVIE